MPSKLTAARSWLIACLLLFTTASFAQQKTVTGKILGDKDKQPIYGATVTVKGSNVATQTGADGTFRITVPNNNSVLVVTFVGYESIEVPVGDKATLDINLKDRSTTLTDVVVTGYSSQAKKDITGSVAVVKVEDLKSVPAASAESQLQGRASGVTVTTSGRPGDGASVRIRGFASFSSGNDPLFIIDGVPGSLNGINPNDIESMQVLKDAASASIYGSRASNGVIVVTTKKGKVGAAKVSYNMYYGQQYPGKGFTNLLNSQEMADLTWLSYRNANQPVPTAQYGTGANPVIPDYILPTGKMEGDPAVDPAKYNLDLDNAANFYQIVRANKAGTNWFNELTDVAPIMNHNISVSGGADRSRFMFSFDYFDQDGIIIHNFYKRYTVRVNSEFNIKRNIRIGENIQIMYAQDNNAGQNGEGTEIGMAYRNQPIIPVYDIMGNYAGTRAVNTGNASNPVATRIRAADNRGHNMSVFGNMYAEVDFLKHFTVRSSIGGNYGTYNWYGYSFKTYENSENNTGNSYTEEMGRSRSWTWTNLLTYKHTFGEHDITALAGTEAVEEWGRWLQGFRADYFVDNPNFRSVSSGASGQRALGTPWTPAALWSYFGKIDYAYADKWLASVTVRRDGSSRFGPNNRWGTFPAASVGWRISRESFMQDLRWITDLKLRASYGTMGNQRINPANAFSQFSQGLGSSFYDINGASNSTVQGFQPSFIGNPDGKWETNVTSNIGFDATLFGGKTELIVEYYEKKTEDLLYRLPQVASGGAAVFVNPAFFNVGSMKNTGIDVLLTHRTNIGGSNGVNLDFTGTFTTYKNTITEIAESIDFFDFDNGESGRIGGVFTRNAVGHPMSAFFGYRVTGLFQSADEVSKAPVQDGKAPGRFRYADIDGNDTINSADRVFFGNPNPELSYGLNINASWKSFDLSAFFYGVHGKDAINYVRWWTDFFPSFQGNKSTDALYNSWSPTNTGAKTPIAENLSNFSNNNAPNSYYLEDASYLRLKNLTLGYSLPTSMLNKFKIDRFRIYVQATNLFTITKYTGLDPEIIGNGNGTNDNGLGFDAGVYPTVKQFLIGVNLNF